VLFPPVSLVLMTRGAWARQAMARTPTTTAGATTGKVRAGPRTEARAESAPAECTHVRVGRSCTDKSGCCHTRCTPFLPVVPGPRRSRARVAMGQVAIAATRAASGVCFRLKRGAGRLRNCACALPGARPAPGFGGGGGGGGGGAHGGAYGDHAGPDAGRGRGFAMGRGRGMGLKRARPLWPSPQCPGLLLVQGALASQWGLATPLACMPFGVTCSRVGQRWGPEGLVSLPAGHLSRAC
jgi:hypothetical protein